VNNFGRDITYTRISLPALIVSLPLTDVSKEYTASILIVGKQIKQETNKKQVENSTLLVTYAAYSSTLKMDITVSCET
jgi:hypothetical protein